MTHSHRRYALLAAGLGIAAIVYFLSRRWQPNTPAMIATQDAPGNATAQSALASWKQPGDGVSANPGRSSSDSLGELPGKSDTDAQDHRGEPETALFRARDAVRAAKPDIADYERLRAKALPTVEEQNQLRAMLKDRELIAAAKRDLTASESVLSEEAQYGRMARVDFLDAALEWGENPERATVLLTIEEVILASNVVSTQPIELQRSIAGDKAELYMSLLDRDAPRAEIIADKAKGTPFEKLIAYAQLRHNAAKAYANGGG